MIRIGAVGTLDRQGPAGPSLAVSAQVAPPVVPHPRGAVDLDAAV